jgi:hypothetical protein
MGNNASMSASIACDMVWLRFSLCDMMISRTSSLKL